jgi:hypothetical protein
MRLWQKSPISAKVDADYYVTGCAAGGGKDSLDQFNDACAARCLCDKIGAFFQHRKCVAYRDADAADGKKSVTIFGITECNHIVGRNDGMPHP